MFSHYPQKGCPYTLFMKKNFQVGQKVKVTVKELYGMMGKTGEIESVELHTDSDMVKITGGGYAHIRFASEPYTCMMRFREIQPVKVKCQPTKRRVKAKPLLQVIVNTDGLSRTVRQERNELGQFIKGARVGPLLNPTHVLHLAAAAKDYTVVMVSHHYTGGNQTVMSVNKNSGKGNGVTFINDGKLSTPDLHDSIFGGK